jgi:hypothetical protein
MRKEASVLAERGNKEQAERLERKAGELLEAAERMDLKAKGRGEKGDRPGIDNEAQRLKERLHDLLAKEKKLSLVALPDIDIANPPQDVPNGFLIAQQAGKTAVGAVSNAVDYDLGTLLIHVSAKELRKRPDAAAVRQSQADSLSSQERMSLFQSWFKKQNAAAKVITKFGQGAS